MAITLQESLRAVFYAPFYLTLTRGTFEREGVEIRFVSAPTPGAAGRAVMDGVVDVSWGGPMRVMETYELDPACDLVCFGEVVTRDPFMLVGRAPRPAFELADLRALRVGTVSEVPTPWLCLQHDLRQAGIDPSGIDRVADRTMGENCAALADGTLDVVQVFEPFASQAVDTGVGHVWYSAANRGPTSYTTFYARRTTLATRREELTGMVRAIRRTQQWVAGATAGEIAHGVADYFPAVEPQILEASCARYQTLGIWGRNPILPRRGYERLRESLVSGSFVRTGAPFETAVDNSLAEAAASSGA